LDMLATAAAARDAKCKLDDLRATARKLTEVLEAPPARALARAHALNLEELEAFMRERNVVFHAPTLEFYGTLGASLDRVTYGKYKGEMASEVFSCDNVRRDRWYMAKVLAGYAGAKTAGYVAAPPELRARARQALEAASVCGECLGDVSYCRCRR
jgi:hypothetical protein